MTYKLFAGCLTIFLAVYSQAGRSSDEILEQYKSLFSQQQKEFEKQRQIIIEQGKEIEKLKSRLDSLTQQPAGQQSTSNRADKGAEQPDSAKLPHSKAVAAQPVDKRDDHQAQARAESGNLPSGPVGQAPPKQNEKPRPPEMPRLSDSVGGVLTRKGKIVIEPSLEYAFTGGSRVFLDAFTFLPAIAIGLIDIRQIKQHSLMASIGARYGLTDRLEIEARVPYRARFDEQRSRPVSIGAAIDETFNASGNGLGDIEFAARYQLNSGAGGWPILVGNLQATAPTGKGPFDIKYARAQGVPGAVFPTEVPTGSGFFSFEPSVTALYATDPAVFFANLAYNYNMGSKQKAIDGSGDRYKVDPGYGLGLTVGMGFGINERSSFNIAYSHRHIFNTRINNQTLKGSQLDIGQLLIGYAFKYSPQTTLNFSFAIGTTEDAQDVRLSFRVPMVF
ncbi:transporter [Nitrosomonas sp.]|uniref:transporter n=1 Tax=Nitrosomonas sp. TaxID=42353 RepID=UPI0025EDE818|nr:transporter [Nitrosomonas sp.]MCC6915809.1 transporter [Nitrosomonas sp.]